MSSINSTVGSCRVLAGEAERMLSEPTKNNDQDIIDKIGLLLGEACILSAKIAGIEYQKDG